MEEVGRQVCAGAGKEAVGKVWEVECTKVSRACQEVEVEGREPCRWVGQQAAGVPLLLPKSVTDGRQKGRGWCEAQPCSGREIGRQRNEAYGQKLVEQRYGTKQKDSQTLAQRFSSVQRRHHPAARYRTSARRSEGSAARPRSAPCAAGSRHSSGGKEARTAHRH